jgi:GDSL-like Lipase/Acylhydrolase family
MWMSVVTTNVDQATRKPPATSLWGAAAGVLITILVFCGVMEIALRVFFHRSLDFSMEMWKYAVALKQRVPDPSLSFAHVPNRSAFLMGVPVSINSHGLRDREYTEAKPPGVIRVIMLGDSTTFGWGVREEDTVAKILERELNRNAAPGHPYEVLNAGVGNYGSVQEYHHYLTYDRVFHPDIVVLEYCVNDPEPVPQERNAGLLGRSYLFAFTVSRLDLSLRFAGTRPNWKEYYAGLYRPELPAYGAAKKALLDLADVIHADGAQFLVATLPELHEINPYPFAAQYREIEQMLRDRQIPVIELVEGLRGHGPESSLWVTPADAHPNLKANTLIAAQILPRISACVPK